MARKQTQTDAPEAVTPEGPELLTLRQAAAYLGVTDQRVRTILREGRVEATKNEKGYWRVTTEALDAYNVTKGTRQAGAKAYVFKADAEQLEAIQAAFEDAGLEVAIEPRYKYDPAKAKAYRLARAEKQAAAAEAEEAAQAESES